MDDATNETDRPHVLIVFQEPAVRPGTPEAQARGCLCRFETNLAAGFLAAERGYTDQGTTIIVIHKDCPLHKIINDPTGDVPGHPKS
jgi:hypothetical protein